MHRLSAALIALVFLAMPAHAAPPDPRDPGNACAATQRDLGVATQALRSCETNLVAVTARSDKLSSEVDELDRKLSEAKDGKESSQTAREQLCASTGNLVNGILSRKAITPNACVSAEQQSALQRLLGGWSSIERLLQQLAAYSAGEIDSTSATPQGLPAPFDRLMGKLVGGSRGAQSLASRRLLVEALARIAPKSLRRLRAYGGGALDVWFAGNARLDDVLVAEVRADADGGDAASQSEALAAAHQLIGSFLIVAGCGDHGGLRGCTRARQLLDLLDSSGPLVARRRVQTIWATDCAGLAPTATLEWLRDLPAGAREGRRNDAWNELLDTAEAKLFSCYLREPGDEADFATWAIRVLPSAHELDSRELARLDELRRDVRADTALRSCGSAVHALRRLAAPVACGLGDAALRPIAEWARHPSSRDDSKLPARVRACGALTRALWDGKAATIPGSFPRPPAVGDWVEVEAGDQVTPMGHLRDLCNERIGALATFVADIGRVGRVADALGESPGTDPWRLEPATFAPVESARLAPASKLGRWLSHALGRTDACNALGIKPPRCAACVGAPEESFYDCTLLASLQARWSETTRRVLGSALLLLLLAAIARWLGRLRRARADFGTWLPQAQAHFAGVGMTARPDPYRYLWPERMAVLSIDLPSDGAWERWGTKACAVRVHGTVLTERDVNRSAAIAQDLRSEVVLLVHDERTGPDLSAVRSMLEWAARTAGRAVQTLPVSMERLKWAAGSRDLLDLIEESSLRGNPFEVRGRITSSSQFFNRERLVSGLLAGAQSGHWTVVTGLRRFGKSSLALEVARRLPGPSAYIDLAGFYHELSRGENAGDTADAILRFACLKLHESARERDPNAVLPDPPTHGLDAAELTRWFGALVRAGGSNQARTFSALLIFDELEQALGLGREHLRPALDVLSIVLGRLRGALADPVTQGGARVGILLCSALHPSLWAPLATLAGQSIMGACQSVCVPCLPDDASRAMMRGLGARQGIRFTDQAIEVLVRESQGVPLLLRRLGSSVLELYDPERARQGALGAVEIGLEGANAAVAREREAGAPLRVWIETEIAENGSLSGVLLRHLAEVGHADTVTLRRLATERVRATFVDSGIDQTLAVAELERRAIEAGSVVVRLLGESGLLVPDGDLTNPEGYTLPPSLIRRVLR